MSNTKLFVINNCKVCPACATKFTQRHWSRPVGYSTDYVCTLANKQIVRYVESPSEEPQDGKFPDFCPLADGPQKND